ncbi:MAG: protoporphyrinogen oxidase [Bacteroidota bacterium]|nr:protoporphyrinogen oxidase [Bacteroidota bacterium]
MQAAKITNRSDNKSVVIIGAGISGLCVAHWLMNKGINVTILEKDSEPGGTMKTLFEDGWLVEMGPNSALETTPLLKQLFDELGILDQRIYANDTASKRYIVRDGMLHPIPMSPAAFIKSRLWTTAGKLRLLKEPFIKKAEHEETISEFVQRRLGQEFLDYAINPFVAGVYAGDPDKLSVRSAFPKLYALEEKYGGLVKGAIKSRRERKQRKEVAKDRAKLFSFTNGMNVLPKRIAEELGNRLKLNCSVEQIIPTRIDDQINYSVMYSQNGVQQKIKAGIVVLATPAYATANIIREIDPAMAVILESIYYPPVAEIFLGFDEKQIERDLDGFGFLVPKVEHRKILGTIWSSTLFPNRASKGNVALTTFVGGARQPELVSLNDDDLTKIVLEDLEHLMQVHGKPVYKKIIRWEKAIPQYNLGYYKVIDALENFEQKFRGIFICSNFRGGIAVGDCVMSAQKISEQIQQNLVE